MKQNFIYIEIKLKIIMSKDKLAEKINETIDKHILRDFTNITEKVKEDGRKIFDKIATFWNDIGEDFDISSLEIYLEKPFFFFENGPLGKSLASQVNNKIMLARELAEKPADVRTFIITHEIIHFLTHKDTEVRSAVHKRAGYGLRHMGYNEIHNKAEERKVFFEFFNEGMTDWLTVLVLGEEYERIIVKYEENEGKLYELVELLVTSVEDVLTQDEIVKDYINRGVKFMQAIHKKYGKHSITILNQMDMHNLNDTLEFFKTDNEARRNELRNKLLESEQD